MMSLVSAVNVKVQGVAPEFLDKVVDATRRAIAKDAWRFYEANKDEVALSVSLLRLFSYSVRYSQLRPLFVRLFGEPGE